LSLKLPDIVFEFTLDQAGCFGSFGKTKQKEEEKKVCSSTIWTYITF
jgi:hypothetical protein